MKSGLAVLNNRIRKEEIKSHKYLPISFLEFSTLYELGANSFDIDFLREEGIDFNLPLTNVVYKGAGIELTLEYIYSVDEIDSILEAGEEYESPFIDRKMLKIANCNSPSGSAIYILCEGNQSGEVYLGEEGAYILLSKDIFDFAGQLRTEVNPHQLDEANRLYKLWNEGFWRLKNPT